MSIGPLLDITDMTVIYAGSDSDVLALNGVTLSIGRGEMIGIIGESGSGKSTLARSIVGLLARNARIQSGQIRFAGELVFQPGADRLRMLRGDRIGMVFQYAAGSLDPVVKVGAQLREVVRSHRKMSRQEATRTASALLKRLGFEDPDRVLGSYPFQLSGGMCQRVAIAAATITEPDLVIADECTSALDVTTQADVVQVFKNLAGVGNWSLLFVSHDILLAAELCTRLVVMYAGQIVEDGDAREVLTSPRHPYTRALIDAVPLWQPKTALRGIDGTPPQVTPDAIGCPFAPRCSASSERCHVEQIAWTEGENGHGFRCISPVPPVAAATASE
ncbi:MAG TPA: ABC transporter ATP-binding protein [Gaiellaceae bacterium]|jgi:oligopeptide/dipeptide ABC transporter ATP-binding protein|nr:ABC transporter ATP-binding protein [Gaiellaceae bacterium]